MEARWPGAELHQCEWHLQHALERLLAKEVRSNPSEELEELRARAEGALAGPSFWRPFVRTARTAENESLDHAPARPVVSPLRNWQGPFAAASGRVGSQHRPDPADVGGLVARAGDVIELPQLGERFIFHKTSADTGGAALEVEQVFSRGSMRGIATWPHVHSRQSERHEVLSGNLGMRVGRRKLRLGPGEDVEVPPGTAHRLFAVDDGEVHVLLDIRPALQTESAFEVLGRLASEGKVNRWGAPSPLQFAVLADKYGDENRLAWPPIALQAAVVRMLAALGRRRGYRA
jgi:mannose-6-phosphate isomerase-like protein (cupin superfamily)